MIERMANLAQARLPHNLRAANMTAAFM